jgi:predicted GNAT family acetyltransferase
MDLTFEHDAAAHQYRLRRDGTVVSIADYRVDGSTRVFHHTLTQPEYREHGYAAELVRRALDDVRASGDSVIATCWYVAGFIDAHPEYEALLA